MKTCASVRDLPAAGKRIDAAGGALPHALNRIALRDPGIEVWLARLDLAAGQIRQCASVLSRDEQLRAERFHFARDRRRFVVARGRLRQLLGGYLGIAPAAIAFEKAKNGKLSVTRHAAAVQFNVAHSDERAIYAVSRRCALGVDIECLNRDVDCDRLAERFFTQRERTMLRRIPEAERKRAFLACWTRKEAVVKATGDGLALPLDQFDVTVAPDAAPRLRHFAIATQRTANWHLYAANVGSDYVATIAAFQGKQ